MYRSLAPLQGQGTFLALQLPALGTTAIRGENWALSLVKMVLTK